MKRFNAWLLGLDLRTHSEGPTRFAAWLLNTTQNQDDADEEPLTVRRVEGGYVLAEEELLQVLRYAHLDEVMAKTKERCEHVIADAKAHVDVLGPTIERGVDVTDTLEAMRTRLNCGGTIIGRAAGMDEQAVVRLGSVARTALRKAHAPVVVVPPDLDPARLGDGPVIALTDLQDDAITAAEFARDFADTLDRPWTLVHVISSSLDYGHYYIEPEALAAAEKEAREQAEQRLADWAKQHNLAPEKMVVLAGPLLEVTETYAEQTKAPLLAVGSRKLNVLERFLFSSVGSEMAAQAKFPVAVVPPETKA